MVQASNTQTIERVRVIARLPDSIEGFERYEFTLSDLPKHWRTNICPDRRLNFVAGNTFDEWTFERREMCWSFAGRKYGFTVTKDYLAKENRDGQ
jgi:hypothetical protein